MGSRAVVLVCRDDRRPGGGRPVRRGRRPAGAVYTRTGRPFFAAGADRGSCWTRFGAAIAAAGLWDELDTGWLLLDCELLPWSAKAEDLLRAPVRRGRRGRPGRAARRGRAARPAPARGLDVAELRRPDRGPAGQRGRVHRRLPPVLLADRRAGRRAARAVPGAGHRAATTLPPTGTTAGTWTLADRLVAAAPGLIRTTRRLVVDSTRPGLGGRRGRLVGRS